MNERFIRTLSLFLSLTLFLTACSGQSTGTDPDNSDTQAAEDPSLFHITARIGGEQDTLDPAKATAQGSETILFHLFENLMRWEDDGSGYATLAPGQAESYEVETDYAGNATYTFHLRENIFWSDGEAVTAQHFVAAWQRLADPANDLPHSSLLRVVAGYEQVQETGDVSHLAVSAPDKTTFVVTLNGSCAYFLEEICASAYTMPVRPEFLTGSAWGNTAESTICNGPYVAETFRSGLLILRRSETYYHTKAVIPDQITIQPASDSEAEHEALLNGTLQLMEDLPLTALELLSADENWRPEAVTSTYGVMLNTLAPPFDDPDVRLAFRLAIDTQAAADALGSYTAHAATGLVPYGISDHGPAPATTSVTGSITDPNAQHTEEESSVYWDFRTHSETLLTLSMASDYETSCEQARTLMARAGYPNGINFPTVTYIYVGSEAERSIALALQSMWQEQLGVTVKLQGLSQSEHDAMLTVQESTPAEDGEAPALPAAAFQMAGQRFTASLNDAGAFLDLWHSASEQNVTGYRSDACDILLDCAEAAVSAEARDAYLHDAEAILLTDAPVIPIYYSGGSYQLADGSSGLYRAPNGVFFLSAITNDAS